MITLSGEEFESAATRGLGRAILFAQQAASSVDRDIIEYVTLNNTAYDPQAEGTRGWYVAQLIRATHSEDEYFQVLQEALENMPPNDDWDERHRLSIVAQFAKDGHSEMRRLFYDRAGANIRAGFYDAIDFILGLDGVGGIEFIVEQFTVAGHDLGEVYECVVDCLGDSDDVVSLPIMMKLREHVKPRGTSGKEAIPEIKNYADYKVAVMEGRIRSRLLAGRWVSKTSDGELRQAAEDMMALQPDEYDKWLSYLAIFCQRPFPLDPKPLLALARKYVGEPVRTPEGILVPEASVLFRSFVALARIRNRDVREFALECITWGTNLDLTIRVLERNFQPGDWPLIAGLVQDAHSIDILHSFGFSVEILATQQPAPEALPALITLIERDPCSRCRYRLLLALRRFGQLPALLEAESHFDSLDATRKWASDGFQMRSEE